MYIGLFLSNINNCGGITYTATVNGTDISSYSDFLTLDASGTDVIIGVQTSDLQYVGNHEIIVRGT